LLEPARSAHSLPSHAVVKWRAEYAVEAKQMDRSAGAGGVDRLGRRLAVGGTIRGEECADRTQGEPLGARAARRPGRQDRRELWRGDRTSVASDADRLLPHRRHRLEPGLATATGRLGGEEALRATGRRVES